MLVSIRLQGAGASFDGTTVLDTSDAKLTATPAGSNIFVLSDNAGVSLETLGFIPLSFLAEQLGSKMGRVAMFRHDGSAGVTEVRAGGGYIPGGTVTDLTKTRIWNPTQSKVAPGVVLPNPNWGIFLFSNQVGDQSMLFEILPLDQASALAAAEDTEAFGSSEALAAANVATTFTATKTAAYDAGAGQIVLYDTSGGAFSVMLPADPIDGDVVGFVEAANSAVNALTINGNGNDVQSPSAGTFGATTTYNIASGYVFLKFDDGTGWRIISVRD